MLWDGRKKFAVSPTMSGGRFGALLGGVVAVVVVVVVGAGV